MCLSAICASSFENPLFNSCAHFFIVGEVDSLGAEFFEFLVDSGY
jgi:hypothetical protein